MVEPAKNTTADSAGVKKKLPVIDAAAKAGGAGKAAKTRTGGWQAFTDGGTAPGWLVAARVVLVLAFAATIPTILMFEHGNRVLWTVGMAALPFFWMTVGFHVWRRICPLAVAGQLGRLVGVPGARKMGAWMGKNYMLVQLGLMVVALSLRLTLTNGGAIGLAGFFGVVVLGAIVVSFVYGGKTWCNFLCPVGLVEKIYTEPARSASGAAPELTSQCAPCVACKTHCPDIDLEQGYWKEATERGRRIAYFSWPGIVLGFYTYYFLASGRWSYYFDGSWAYERAPLANAPGLYFATQIPRAVAAPLTLLAFGLASFVLFAVIEKLVLAARALPATAGDKDREGLALRVRHGLLALAGLIAFNLFYCFAGQPTLQKLPHWIVTGWGLIVVFASTTIFMRRVSRSEDKHVQEKFAQKILKKWEWGDAPPSDDLKDIYLLHTERTKQREARLRAYKETVREMVADGLVTRGELVLLDSVRAQLGISDNDHQKILGELSAEERQLFDPSYHGSVEQRLAKQQYRKDLARIVVEAARQGAAPAAATLAALRNERGVDDAEESAALEEILAPGGPIGAIYTAELAEMTKLVVAAEAASPPSSGAGGASSESASLALLRHLAQRRAHEHALHALGILAVMTKRPEVEQVRQHAKSRGLVDPGRLAELGPIDDALRTPFVELVTRLCRGDRGRFALEPLLAIAADESPHLRAVVAMLLSCFEDGGARSTLLAMLDDASPIVRESAVRAMGDANAAIASLTTIEKMMLIRQVPIFADLDAEDLEELASIVEERVIHADKDLFREGDAGDSVYLIVNGKVRVFVGGGDRPETTVDELGAGACIGEIAVLDSSPRLATVRSLERTRTLRVPGEGFKRVMTDRPEMSAAIVAELVRRLHGLTALTSSSTTDALPK